VIILDANILLCAYDSSSARHAEAKAWIEKIFSEGELVGIPWQTAHAFLRIATNPKLPGRRFSMTEASEVVDSWQAQPNIRFLRPGEQHWSILRRMLVDGQAKGSLVTDAQLAALTIEHGGELNTTDRDFARFPGVRWNNPLE
jgi:uncharacterized protein